MRGQTIGDLIRLRRKARQLSMAALAARLGRHRSTVLRYETGVLPIEAEELARIAEALGCGIAALYPPRRKTAA